MAYSKEQMVRSIKYVKEHQKQVVVKYKNEEFESRIRPAVEKSGMPMATFIKQAVNEKILRDGLLEQQD